MSPTSTRLAGAKRNLLAVSLCAALSISTSAVCEELASSVVRAVATCADDGSSETLRAAIENAADNDTIDLTHLECSVITLQAGPLTSLVPHLTIEGPGAEALTIDGNSSGRVLEGKNLDVRGLTIAHGVVTAGTGGACVETEYDLSLTDAVLTNCVTFNVAGSAVGGAASVLGNLTMRRSAISASKVSGADAAAGGAAAVAGTTKLYDSSISGNRAEGLQGKARGGGLFSTSDVTLYGSLIANNFAESSSEAAYGGGVQAYTGNVFVFDGSTITGNSVGSETMNAFGGGINTGAPLVSTTGTVEIENSVVMNNEASSACASCVVRGGGVNTFNAAVAKYSTLAENHATCATAASTCTATGGGIAAFGTQPNSSTFLMNTTISSNTVESGTQFGALGIGGGVWLGSDRPLLIDNSTVAFNIASTLGGGVAGSSPATTPSSFRSSLFSNNVAAGLPNDVGSALIGAPFVIGGGHDLVTAAAGSVALPAGTLTSDPHLQDLTLDDGGMAPVHPIPANSIAVDAGSNENGLKCDQRAFPYARVRGASADIGAYEAQGEAHLFFDNFDGTGLCMAPTP